MSAVAAAQNEDPALAEDAENNEGDHEQQWVKVNQNTVDTIDAAYKRINEIENERKALNATKKEVRANLERMGINLIAFDAASKYRNMDPDKREGFDLSYAVARLSLGQPLQDDLFEGALREELRNYAQKTTH